MRPLLVCAVALVLASLRAVPVAAQATAAPAPEAATSEAAAQAGTTELPSLLVLPFRLHSARSLDYLGESLADLLTTRLEASGRFQVVERERVASALEADAASLERSDDELRQLAQQLGALAAVRGSLTELAGRYSLDVRVTPAAAAERSHTIVITADGDKDLIARLGELSEQVVTAASGAEPGRIVSLQVLGAGDLEPLIRSQIASQAGTSYDPAVLQADRAHIETNERVARVSLETERTPQGISIVFRVVRAESILGQSALARSGVAVVAIELEGNRRIESEAIRARIRTQVGDRLNRSAIARDVREIYGLGFFRTVDVLAEDQEGGVRLVFQLEENPVVREISITGNDNVKSDKIRDILTLTTGSSLDHPLLHENKSRIEQLYRAEGYYLAKVDFRIEEATEGAVAVDFEVREGEKLKLRRIDFAGNEAFSDGDLQDGFSTKRWRFHSWATSWFDRTGTFSEPIFGRDLRGVEKKYTDAGYLQVEVGEPSVEPSEEGLFVTVPVKEGPQFRVGEIEVAGDETVDLETLRGKLKLEKGDIFNRSFLTQDVESLERHYTDRGFYFASVQPGTRLSEATRTVDVRFSVEKGPLYFVRHVEIEGNTRTIDPVIRREVAVVEGQLYSARALRVTDLRLRGIGFFEDIGFEPQPTDDPSQLDLEIHVVEKPTGSFSFGAGYSSQDGLVFTASLAQANLFGRGYGVNVSVDIGGSTNRFFVSLSDPYFLGSSYSFGGTVFITDVDFDTFEQHQRGFDVLLGHALSEDNTSRGFLRYSFASREVIQDTGLNAAAPIFREILQGNESSSMLGVSFRRDTRDDRFSATSGTNASASLDYSGIGGFARYLRAEGRMAWYMGAPRWLIDRSTFVASTRVGYALPFNEISDWDLALSDQTLCDDPSRCENVGRLDQIDTDLKLPLTERYFLGGIGNFQLRGFRARSVGPRRAILQRSGITGTGDLFHPVGTSLSYDSVSGRYVASCADSGFFTQGDGDGTCNQINTRELDEFGDIDETDAIGGSSFISSSLEYRFPISQAVGLQGVFFLDGGNSFYEGQNLFDASQWRYGYGGGVLWFSPFGPLQLVLGFPIDPYSFEESPVFEFSVGGFGL